MHTLTPAAVLAAALLASTCWAGPADEVHPLRDHPTASHLDEHWKPMLEQFETAGAAVVLVYSWTAGVRDTETGAGIDVDTMFYIASITKTHTAAAIGTLEKQGLLSVTDIVRTHVPRFMLPDTDVAEAITIEDLISHRRGLNIPFAVALDAYTGEITDDRYFELAFNYGITRGQVRYTNENFTLAGRVIESVTGKTWQDYLDESLFEPLGMTRTTAYATAAYEDSNVAFPSMLDQDSGEWVKVQRKDDSVMHAAGGLMTTGRDAARWLMHVMDDRNELLSDSIGSDWKKVQAAFPEPNGTIRIMEGYGYGWNIGTFNDMPLVSHGGGYRGASAFFAALPGEGKGVAVLYNSGPFANYLADVMVVEALEALTGTEAAWPVHERYSAAIEENPPSIDIPSIAPLALEDLPHGEKLLGTYEHRLFGTVTLWHDDGLGVRGFIGKLEVGVAPAEGGIYLPELESDVVVTPLFAADGSVAGLHVPMIAGDDVELYPVFTRTE